MSLTNVVEYDLLPVILGKQDWYQGSGIWIRVLKMYDDQIFCVEFSSFVMCDGIAFDNLNDNVESTWQCNRTLFCEWRYCCFFAALSALSASSKYVWASCDLLVVWYRCCWKVTVCDWQLDFSHYCFTERSAVCTDENGDSHVANIAFLSCQWCLGCHFFLLWMALWKLFPFFWWQKK